MLDVRCDDPNSSIVHRTSNTVHRTSYIFKFYQLLQYRKAGQRLNTFWHKPP